MKLRVVIDLNIKNGTGPRIPETQLRELLQKNLEKYITQKFNIPDDRLDITNWAISIQRLAVE